MRPLVASAVLFALSLGHAAAQYPGAKAPPSDVRRGWDNITEADAKSWLGYLAGPETLGRGTGQDGYQRAAEYVAKKLKDWKIAPFGDDGTYFQNVPMWRSRVVPTSLKCTVNGQSVDLSKDLVFGSGTKLDVAGKIAVVSTAGGEVRDAAALKDHVVFVLGTPKTPTIRQLFGAGAKQLIFVRKGLVTGQWAPARNEPRADRPIGQISVEQAGFERVAKAAGLSPAMPAPTDPAQVLTGGDFTLKGDVTVERVGVPNVVGILEGSDPTLKAETVGIGAHLDHLGVQNGVVYAGADDDGSGSTALLQVAKAFATNPVKPKRSIIFMWFAAEEMGLIGSGYYADNPKMPHAQMIAELQMDMVGRNSDGIQNGDPRRVDVAAENEDTIRLVGSKKLSTELDDLIQGLNVHTQFRFKYDAEDVYTRSDHYNFAKNGIPVAFFFDGFHPEYHQPTDTIEKINFKKIVTTARLVFLTAFELARRPERLRKNGS
ncbi:MAG: M20/M25/M40 family metallo-hydrolase [Fimbriimonadaceae bacterium]|nr:M20/M25/M40 family metallo-hydrolase [Fimbriimonadaceae bacterium]